MNKNFKKIIAGLIHMGIPIENPVDDYNTRFQFQKITYLIQSMGIELNYNFGIYLSGPYCSKLADDYYEFGKTTGNLISDYNPLKEEIEVFEKIKTNVFDKEIKDGRNLEFLETITTLIYLKEKNPTWTEDDFFNEIKQIKPHLSEYIIVIGFNTMKKLQFKQEFLSKEIKEEIKQWDSAED